MKVYIVTSTYTSREYTNATVIEGVFNTFNKARNFMVDLCTSFRTEDGLIINPDYDNTSKFIRIDDGSDYPETFCDIEIYTEDVL